MITNYKNEILSPIQIRKKPFDISGENHPARDEIRNCIGSFNLVITVEEDIEALKLFDHIPGGIVAFKTSIMSPDGTILGVGRNSSIFSRVNKYLSRTVRTAFCGSLIDGIVKSCKAMDAIYLAGPEYQKNIERSPRSSEKERGYVREMPSNYSVQDEDYQPASQKQKNYLRFLLADSEEFNQIDSMSKDEAAEKIGQLVAK